MKIVQLVVGACLACAVTVNAQPPSNRGGVEMTAGQDKFFANLQLHTNVIKFEGCSDDRLRFTLRLKYVNEGKGAVILDKRSSVISHYMLSRNLKNALKRHYEVEVPILFGLDAAGMTMDSVPDESQFVLLKPGEIYSVDEVFSFSIRPEMTNKNSGRVKFLQMVVVTWYYPRASNSKWRDEWQAKGYLWSDAITSVPMPLKIDNKVDCRDGDVSNE